MKQAKYDVVIIGSGLGGITAAALLTKAGFNTLVVERLPFVGGKCATLDYHGYKLNTGVMIVNETIFGTLCKEVGAEVEISFLESMFRFRIGGKDYDSPSSGLMKTMLGISSRDDAEAERVLRAFKRGIDWMEPSNSMSLYDWIKQYTDNPKILGILQFLAVFFASASHFELPAGEFFRMLKAGSQTRTTGFLPQGGGSLSNALVQAIKRRGGEVLTRCRALQIKVKDGVATGVVVRKDSEEIELTARVVVSNANPWQTVEMIGSSHLTSGYLRDVANIKPGVALTLSFTSDRPLLEGSSSLVLTESRRVISLSDFGAMCPEAVPKGKYLLGAYSFFTSSDAPYDINKEVELSLQDLRENIPDFDKYAQVLRINTYFGDWSITRNRGGQSLPIQTPIEGVYVVGDFAAPSGWYFAPGAAQSGRLVAEDITRRYGPA